MKHLIFLSIFFLIFFSSCSSKISTEPELVSIQLVDQNGLSETISAQNKLSSFNSVDFTSQQPYKKVLRVYKKDQEGKSHTILTSYYPNGQIEQYLECISITANGMYRKWHQNGSLHIEAKVIGGPADISPLAQKDWLFEGPCKVFNEDQKLIANITYRKGNLEGLSTYYYPDGVLKEEVFYKQGNIEGIKKTYYKSGTPLQEENFASGVKQGKTTGYFEDEKIAFTEEFEDDFLINGKYHDKEGKLLSEIQKGKGEKTIFYPDNSIEQLVSYKNGLEDGLVKCFTKKGELAQSYFQRQGKKQGRETLYYLKSEGATKPEETKLIIEWDDDTIHGSIKTFYLNGKQESQKEMSRNKKNGMHFAWYENGDLMFMEEYDKDLLTKGTYFERGASDPISKIHEGSGIATIFEKEGTFVRKVVYKKGLPVE